MTFKKLTLLIFVMFSFSIAQDISREFGFAGKLYLDKKYEEAYRQYTKILESGFESGELYYNLGNTAYRLNRKGEAILYYEKALRFLPGDEDILHNLEIVRQGIADRIEMPKRPFYLEWFDYLKQFSATPRGQIPVLWGMILLGSVWGVWIISRRKEFSYWILAAALFLSFIWSVYFLFWNLGHYDKEHLIRGVLLTERSEIKAGPDPDGETLFILHEGADFQIKREAPEWLEIELIDGKKGWVTKKDVGII